MRVVAHGGSLRGEAHRLGYASEAALTSAACRGRDRVFPWDLVDGLVVEFRVVDALGDAVTRSLSRTLDDDRVFQATGLILGTTDLALRLRDARRELDRASIDPDWNEMLVADLGLWTAALDLRADGASFKEIASQLDLDEPFDANQRVASELQWYLQGCAARLRRAQVAHLTRQLDDVWKPATRRPDVQLDAAARAVAILKQRFRVRGVGLEFVAPYIEHSPNPSRSFTTSARWPGRERIGSLAPTALERPSRKMGPDRTRSAGVTT